MASLPADTPLLSQKSGRVKTARRLARRVSRAETRLFLAEGPQAVREALQVPGCVREVFAVPGAADAHPEIHEAAVARGLPWQFVDDAALASLTETVHPQGLVAVCRFLDVPVDDVLDGAPRLLAVCADVRDPGNAGTVIRCADAAGAGGVLLTGSSVDPYNGKAVRASVGSLFHLPLASAPDTAEVVAALQAAGLTVLAADGAGEVDLDDAADEGLLAAPTAWLFGNEAWGLPDDIAALADHRVRIPIHGRAESLNLATAAAVCLYASARAQRDTAPQERSVSPQRG
jgi:TrmH family RNA methyltransferase